LSHLDFSVVIDLFRDGLGPGIAGNTCEKPSRYLNMKKKLLLLFVLVFAVVAAASLRSLVRADAAGEMKRLAALMQWKPGTIVADIGAGDGRFTFAALDYLGASGKIFATEIDPQKLKQLKAEVKRRNLQNVMVIESAEVDTNLADGCCDAIFLRRVYHHLTKPMDFDAKLARSLKADGRLAIIDFPPRPGLEPVEGIPSNRGGHGISQKVVIEELTAAGLQVEKVVNDWPDDSYCVLFVKK
jgi:predicted methyltransferase